MLTAAEALEVVLGRVRPLDGETVGLAAAPGRVLLDPVRADRDQPPFDRALVDGYAVRAESLGREARLRVVAEIAAGQTSRTIVGSGEAAAVMTGAPMPPGADAAIMVEHTVRHLVAGDDFVTWPAPAASPPPVGPGTGVAPRGCETRAGTTLLGVGGRITAAAAGVLASVGRVRVRVGKRPSVAVMSTGDELLHPRARRPGPARIRDANSTMLVARCRALGFRVRRLGIVRDDPEQLRAAIQSGLESDALLLSGGVSMGRFDFVEPVLESLGVRLLVTSVRIRPGKPFVFGLREGGRTPSLVFGLPGNPVSAFTTFELFARPALDRLEGIEAVARPRFRVRLLNPAVNRGPREAFLPGRVRTAAGGVLEAHVIRSVGSADMGAIGQANALLVIPERAGEAPRGARLPAIPLEGFPDPGPGWQDPRA